MQAREINFDEMVPAWGSNKLQSIVQSSPYKVRSEENNCLTDCAALAPVVHIVCFQVH